MKFFLIIQSQKNLHGLDVKHYFPIFVCLKCTVVSYHTFHRIFNSSYGVKNFLVLLSQLNQTRLPVFCDTRKYRILADINQQKKDKFSGIISLLGFHMGMFHREVNQTRGSRWCNSGEKGFWRQDNWIYDKWKSLWLLRRLLMLEDAVETLA